MQIEYTSLLDVRLLKSHGSDNLQSKDAATLKDSEDTLVETNSKLSAARSGTAPYSDWTGWSFNGYHKGHLRRAIMLFYRDETKYILGANWAGTEWEKGTTQENQLGQMVRLDPEDEHHRPHSMVIQGAEKKRSGAGHGIVEREQQPQCWFSWEARLGQVSQFQVKGFA